MRVRVTRVSSDRRTAFTFLRLSVWTDEARHLSRRDCRAFGQRRRHQASDPPRATKAFAAITATLVAERAGAFDRSGLPRGPFVIDSARAALAKSLTSSSPRRRL